MTNVCPVHNVALSCPRCEMVGRSQAHKLKHREKLAEWGRKGALKRHRKSRKAGKDVRPKG